MKMRWIRGLIILLELALIVCVLVQAYVYIEKQDCICAKMTSEEQEFKIDDRLRGFYGDVEDKTGTFILASSSCRHGKSILLTIFPDEGWYKGKVLQ